MMRSVGGIRNSEHQSWLAKGLGLGLELLCYGFKLRGCHYETIEEMKETVTNLIDTLTQEDFHEAFRKLLERYITAGGDYFEGD